MRGGRLPSSASSICSAAIRPMFSRASFVTPAVCGLASTLSNCSSGMIRRRRLLGPDVEARAGNALLRSASLQRRLVVDKSPRRGDEIGMGLHQREFARADHAAVLLGQRAGDRDIVRAPQQILERDLFAAALGHFGRRRDRDHRPARSCRAGPGKVPRCGGRHCRARQCRWSCPAPPCPSGHCD